MSDTTVRIHRLTPDWLHGWDDCVKRSSNGSPYHLSAWCRIFEASCGRTTHFLLAERNGDVVALLPMVHLRSWAFGSFLVSLPWTNYGGLCGSDPDARQRLLAEAVSLARQLKASHMELHSQEPECPSLKPRQHKVSMRRALPSEPEVLWRSFPAKLRSQIRRPQREGIYARFGGVEQLDSFYAIFSRNMRDLGTPVFPRRFFRDVLKTLPDLARICCVFAGDRPVAAGMLIGFKDRLEIPWASSLRSFNRLSPNMLLYWEVLRYACQSGYRWFDFGRSSPDGPHYRFKAQWGAQPVPLYWHYWQDRSEAFPEINPQNPRYQLAIRVWRLLPVSVSRVIGPIIARNLP